MLEQAHLWSVPEFPGLELLHAFYVRHSFPRHTHDFYVIGSVEEGVEAFFNKNQMRYASLGDISLTNPDEIHTGQAGTPAGYRYRAFYPTAKLLQSIGEDITGKAQGVPFFLNAVVPDAEVSSLLLEAHKSFETPASSLEREEKLYRALGLLMLRHADTRLQPKVLFEDSALVKKVRSYLHDHNADSVTLEQLASLAKVTPSYVVRLFKKHVGIPPHEYQTQLRVMAAKRLLQKGWHAAEVALETGFYDQSHLNRHFKRLVGVTAGQYQKALQ
ncbi:MAG: AraC family transcriptional regulator [Trueperaceae bacterium]